MVLRVRRAERSDGYLLAHSGRRFARSPIETGLIVEYRLLLHPVVLGAGERIFPAPLTNCWDASTRRAEIVVGGLDAIRAEADRDDTGQGELQLLPDAAATGRV